MRILSNECFDPAGADEVDVVFPYKSLMQGDESIGLEIVKQCKAACLKSPGNCILKVIIESGELKDPELITKASKICLDGKKCSFLVSFSIS